MTPTRRHRRWLPLLLAAPLLAAAPSAPAGPPPAAELRTTPGPAAAADLDPARVLVTVDPGREGAAALDDVAAGGLDVERAYVEAGVAVVATEGRPVEDVVAELEAEPEVRTATPDFVRRASALPDDPQLPAQLDALQAVRLPAAWDVTRGSRDQVIAVLDSGVDLDHPDLARKLVPGFDAVERDGVPDDDQGHGTFVAGLAAARTDNAVGVAGASWRARIMPVKVLGADGSGVDSEVIAGIDWALDHGADVLNLSLGGTDPNPALDAAVAAAVDRGAVVVAAAGNEATTAPNYPAASPGAIAVGSATSRGRLSYFSNSGGWLDLVAPGFRLTSTSIGAYGVGTGTSFAAPLVAGAASLLRSAEPGLSAASVTARLLGTARDLGAQGLDPQFGRGMLDVAAALGAAPAPVSSPAVDGDGAPARATPLGLGPTPDAGAIVPEGDVDWYRLDLAAPTTLRVTASPDPFDGGRAAELAPVVRVLGPGLTRLGEGRRSDTELADRVRPTSVTVRTGTGAHFVSVRNAFGSRGVPAYDLDVVALSTTPSTPPGPPEWVRDVAPVERSGGVAPTARPSVAFGPSLDPASVPGGVRLVSGRTGRRVRATVVWDGPSRTATVVPDRPLRAGRPFAVRVTGVVDEAGRRMEELFLAPFTVRPAG